ncbi:hypothetical protein [Fischerella sp. PCC 9605]|uniref:hypothetical protein n=1 Tax=Fischerella sp. PCC 9605 TaxID=1173024 RepID=UPI00047E09C7|nr:hypothetical protein [Fischerella sp. PCC 9605]
MEKIISYWLSLPDPKKILEPTNIANLVKVNYQRLKDANCMKPERIEAHRGRAEFSTRSKPNDSNKA